MASHAPVSATERRKARIVQTRIRKSLDAAQAAMAHAIALGATVSECHTALAKAFEETGYPNAALSSRAAAEASAPQECEEPGCCHDAGCEDHARDCVELWDGNR